MTNPEDLVMQPAEVGEVTPILEDGVVDSRLRQRGVPAVEQIVTSPDGDYVQRRTGDIYTSCLPQPGVNNG